MSTRQVYTPEFENRVFDLYQQGITCKPMLDRLIPEFPEYDLTYSKLEDYIERRQAELTAAKQQYQEELDQIRQDNAKLTAKRAHAIEQDALETIEKEIAKCKTALECFQPWEKPHAIASTTLTRLLRDLERLSKTGLFRKLEEAQAIQQIRSKEKPKDPLDQARITQGRVI